MADGTRGAFAAPLGADDNYVTDAEKAALHGHSNKAALDLVSGTNTGDQVLPTWATISGKPTVVAEGATQADARTAIGLGSAATTASTAYATAAQGAKADTAVQPGALAAYPTTGDVADAVAVESAARVTDVSQRVLKGALALSINDYTNTPSAIASVLDSALADGATTERTVALGPGTWITAKASRHQIKSYTGLVGDPSGATTLRFTHASGGLNITDTAGTSGLHVYGTRLRDLFLDGQSVVGSLVTGSKIEELTISNVRVQGWTDAAVALTDASLVNTYRFEAAGTDATIALPAVRLLGGTGSIEFTSPNFFKCSGVELAGPTLTDLRFNGQPWYEACPDLFTVNHPGAAVSIGRVEITGRVINTTATCRLVRTVAAGASTINATIIDVRSLNLTAPSSTTPLFDWSAFANAGNVVTRFRDSNVTLTAFAGQLLTVHASQAWNLMHAEFDGIYGPTPGSLYTTARWFPLLGYNTGGAFARPLQLKGSGTPEAVFTAPVGSIYQRIDVGQLSMYRKVSGFGSTGWQPVDTYGPIKTVVANYTLTYEDSVVLANGTSLTITLPTPASYGGRRFTIKNINASAATVGGTVDGVASPSLALNERMTVVTDGSAWRQID